MRNIDGQDVIMIILFIAVIVFNAFALDRALTLTIG